MKLIQAKENDFPILKDLYHSAFPPEEWAPFRLLWKRFQQGRADFWTLRDGNTWAGMAYVIRFRDLAYLFYFAVEPTQRGKGIGTQALQALQTQYGNCRLFLALEKLDTTADNYMQRVKRHAFYEKCGLKDFPYFIREMSVVYAVMGTGRPVEPDEYKALIRQYLGWPLYLFVNMQMMQA